jgi:hypothetical protein
MLTMRRFKKRKDRDELLFLIREERGGGRNLQKIMKTLRPHQVSYCEFVSILHRFGSCIYKLPAQVILYMLSKFAIRYIVFDTSSRRTHLVLRSQN